MFWSIYVVKTGKLKAEKVRLSIPETKSINDHDKAFDYAKANLQGMIVLCVPTPMKELD